jgi:hypothetical protein
LTRLSRAALSGTMPWTASGSAIICPTVIRGLSEL